MPITKIPVFLLVYFQTRPNFSCLIKFSLIFSSHLAKTSSPANCGTYFRNGSRNSLVVRTPDSWSKGGGFESPQERLENFLLRGQFSVMTLISVSSVLPHYHAKDPGHSAKSAGSRLQLNTHTLYVCGFAWSDIVHGCMEYTECVNMAAVPWGTSQASATSTPLRWIFKNAL